MGGFSPRDRAGLIALLAARRIKAEKLRRAKLADAKGKGEVEALKEDGKAARRSGWFRR